MTFSAILIVALLAPVAAAADPITAWVATTLAVSTATAAFIVRIGISLVLSSLSAALRKKPGAPRPPGIKTESTTSGGSNPQSFILGKYATAGNMVAPPYSHPNEGNVPNKWLTYVVDVSDMPGAQLSRVMVAGEYVTDLEENPEEGPAENPDGKHGLRGMLEDGQNHLYMTWHDGTQTAADAYMLEHYGEHPDRPWNADMVGTGVAYAVVTFLYNRKLFNQLPGVRFEVLGIPLYDPRKDDTAGGAGAHRWDDPETWEISANPIVMVYNILRGITLPDGQRWGGKVSASNLPLDNWFAAMNECDVSIALADGGSEPQYQAGLEVSLDEEPAEVIGEFLKACSAEISEFGGAYKVRVGPPALPVYFFTDEDVVLEHPQNLAPYPGLEGVHNAIHATHPDPESLWETRDAPPRYNAEWEAEDGGRQLVAQVDLPPVASGTQAQRLMKGWIEDERRFRRHSLTLPPDAAVLEPLDAVAWTSAREGYTSKLFEVGELTDDLVTCVQAVSLRERDAGDFIWLPGTDEVPVEHPSTAVTVPGPRLLPGFDLLAHSLPDGGGTARRPALRMVWTAEDLLPDDVVEWEVQLADETLVAAGTAASPLTGEAVFASGILPSTVYRAKGRIRGRNDGTWSGWQTAATGDVRLGYTDLADQISNEIDAAQAEAENAAMDAQAANSAAAAVQGEIDGLLLGYSGSTLKGSLDSLLGSATAYTDVSEQNLSVKVGNAQAQLFPSDFVDGFEFWQTSASGVPGAYTVNGAYYAIHLSGGKNVARCLYGAGNFNLCPRGVIAPVVGRTYRLTVRYRVTGTITFSTGTRVMNAHWRKLDGSYVYTAAEVSVSGYAPNAAWQTVTLDFVCTSANVTPFIRPSMYFRRSDFTNTGVCEVEDFRVEDVTDTAGISADLKNNYYTAADADEAIAARELALQSQINSTNANLQNNYYTAADADEAIAARELALQSQINSTNANLQNNYYTAADADEAIAARELALQSQINSTNANLQNNYYTEADADEAIAATQSTLRAEVDNAVAANLPDDFSEDGLYWQSSTGGAPGSDTLDAVWDFQTDGGEGRVAFIAPENTFSGVHWLLTRGTFRPVVGRRYRITARVKVEGSITGSGTKQFSLFFRSMNLSYVYEAAHGFQDFGRIDPNWNDYSIEIECTTANQAEHWRAGMYFRCNDFTTTGKCKVVSLLVEDITEAHALAASVDIQATAIADLEGNATAGYLIKAQAGSEVSLLQLIAADGSAGSVSVAKLQAEHILLQGSVSMDMLSVGVGRNLLENPDFTQGMVGVTAGGWGNIGDSGSVSIRSDGSYSETFSPTLRIETDWAGTGVSGAKVAYMRPVNDDGSAGRGYPVGGGVWYEFSTALKVRRARVGARLYWYKADGNYSDVTTYTTVFTESSSGGASDTPPRHWARYGGLAQAPSDAAYCMVRFHIDQTLENSGNRDVHIFQPMLAESAEGAQLSPYAPGGNTYMHGGRVVTDSLYADAVNTASFAAAGLSLFGGAMKSTNFNGTIDASGEITAEGSAGWVISKSGGMVLNNLVAREWVKVGAVSDGVAWSRDGHAASLDSVNVTSQTLGPFGLGHFWQIACRVMYRTRSAHDVWVPPEGKADGHNSKEWNFTNVKLQWRTKTGGSWSGWGTLHDFGTTGENLNWQDKEVLISKMGNYQDVQVRLRTYLIFSSAPGYTGVTNGYYNNIDEMTLYAKALIR
ncbi:phage tail protein [Leisingera sp. NJS201]|uniref:phage tail protein n=1 Tax=Leisingera sp. NJS201 TaxID=2508306 RepID=UPI0014306322|nr:phage tail protein [Leisingera sp. NJS201]